MEISKLDFPPVCSCTIRVVNCQCEETIVHGFSSLRTVHLYNFHSQFSCSAGPDRWHGLGTKESFAQAEFESNVYDRYYRRASAIAHGQPYVTVRQGQVRARSTAWKNLSLGVRNQAMLMMATLLGILNREFELGLEDKLGGLQQDIEAHLKQHMEDILKLADTNKGSNA